MPALFIALPGQDATDMDGRALLDHIEQLDALAHQAGVKPLTDLAGADVIAEYGLDEDEDIPGYEPHDTQWFPAAEGLRTIRALIEQAPRLPGDVLDDLRDAERILSSAEERGQPFTFAYDL